MFRNETPEVLEIKNCLLKWSKEEWQTFKNGRLAILPVSEYAFLLHDEGFNPEKDSVEKASKMIWLE